jgi:hypothetical protein
LKHLYVEELKDLYSAENQLLKAIPEMARLRVPRTCGMVYGTPGPNEEEHVARQKRFSKPWEKALRARNVRAWRASSRKERN